MKVTYNWLKEFVDIKISPRELADRLTMAGLEVVSLEEREGDSVLEIEITSNRPDWLSVYGIAREVAAITGKKIKPGARRQAPGARGKTKNLITIEDKKDCPLYTARIIKGVKVGASPEWLSKRLELVGCRSVNSVVDITNYVLFELGEPLHAFDADKLNSEQIFVRRGRRGEKIVTLDAQERVLDQNILVIADSRQPVAVAGVMGGKDTEVGLGTRNILLEAALFNPVLVRRGRQAQGLQSESSYRFERGVDLEAVERASRRALELIKEICAGEEASFQSSGLIKPKKKNISLSLSRASKVLGVDIRGVSARKILTGLGFSLKQRAKDVFKVGIPSFRQDVNLEEDLIEEIARVFGYARIPASLPKVSPQVNIRERRDLVLSIKNILTGLGLNEAITYGLTDLKILHDFRAAAGDILEVANPLSREQGALRTTLLPGLCRAVAHNLNQKQDHVALFEAADVFFKKDNAPCEELKLGIVLSGAKTILLSEGAVKDEPGMLNLKGIVETLFNRLGVSDYELVSRSGASAADIYAHKENVGSMSVLTPELLDKIGIKNRDVFTLEVSLEKILSFARLGKKYAPLPKYPGITRDISFILKEENFVREIISALKEKGRPFLRSIAVIDYYRGKQIPPGYRGLTLSFIYGSDERTLTEEEILPAHNLICSTLTGEFGAKIR